MQGDEARPGRGEIVMLDSEDVRRWTLRDAIDRECVAVNVVAAGVSTELPGGHCFRLVNVGTKTAFVRSGNGSTTCDTATGHPVLAGAEIEFKVESETHIFSITAGGDSTTLAICPAAEA